MELRRILLSVGVAPALAGVALLSACGGDGGGSGSDEDFVADLCNIMKEFGEDIDNIDLGDIDSEEDAFAAFAEPFEKLADDFGDLNPPDDMKDWHDEASDRLSDAAEQFKDGNIDDSLLEGDNPIPDPPKDAADRLSKIAEDNEDCQDAEFDFDS